MSLTEMLDLCHSLSCFDCAGDMRVLRTRFNLSVRLIQPRPVKDAHRLCVLTSPFFPYLSPMVVVLSTIFVCCLILNTFKRNLKP